MELDSIVNVVITRETKAVTRAGFGTLLVIGTHKVFNERVREYSNAADMLTDGFEVTDPEYKAGLAFFSQNPNQSKLLIGRVQADQAVVTAIAVNDFQYDVIINGTTFSFTSDSDATLTEISLGLKTQIDLGSEPVTVVDNTDGSIDIDPNVAGTAFTVTVGSNLTVTKPFTGSETQLAAYTAILGENSDFYAVASTNRTQSDVEALAAQILTESRIYGTTSSDANILDAVDVTNIASVLNAATNERAFVMYHTDPTTFPEVAWLSRQLSTDPGSSTWKFKTLLGITATNLTVTESTNAINKKANTYETVGGVNITAEGTMASGEFIDIIRGIDWFTARLTERVFSRLVNLEKIPFTDAGITVIEAEVRNQLNDGIDQGLIAADPVPTISVPLAADVSTANKTARLLPDVSFQATLAGAIHFVTIEGVLAV